MGDVAYFMTKKLILKESIFFISIIIFYQEQSFFAEQSLNCRYIYLMCII